MSDSLPIADRTPPQDTLVDSAAYAVDGALADFFAALHVEYRDLVDTVGFDIRLIVLAFRKELEARLLELMPGQSVGAMVLAERLVRDMYSTWIEVNDLTGAHYKALCV